MDTPDPTVPESSESALPVRPTPPLIDITLEEWIAASQACCGREPVDDDEPNTRPDPVPN